LEWAQNAILRYPYREAFVYPSDRGSCIEGSGESRDGEIILNLTGRPLTFVMVVKARVSGINLINYSRKVGFSDPVELVKDFKINLN
jgi:hypothetical protein